MPKWRESAIPPRTGTEVTVPWRTTIDYRKNGSIKSIETHYRKITTFSDGSEVVKDLGSTVQRVSSLDATKKALVNTIDNSLQELDTPNEDTPPAP